MKKPHETEKTVKEKDGQNTKTYKTSSCCGPTCCGDSSSYKKNNRKEK